MDYKKYIENPNLLHECEERNRAYYVPYLNHNSAWYECS